MTVTTVWAPNKRQWGQDFTDGAVTGATKTVEIYTNYSRYFAWGSDLYRDEMMPFDRPNRVRAGLQVFDFVEDPVKDLTILEIACSLTTKRYKVGEPAGSDTLTLHTTPFEYNEYRWRSPSYSSPMYYSVNGIPPLTHWIEFDVAGLDPNANFWIYAKVNCPADVDLYGKVELDAVAKITWDLEPFVEPPPDPPGPITVTTPRNARILATIPHDGIYA